MKPNLALKAAIVASGMRQKDVADALNVTELWVSNRVTGRRKLGKEEARRLARTLHVPVEQIEARETAGGVK